MTGNRRHAITIETLLRIMAMLRDEDHGCPWDRKQTFRTIAPHTLEEVYEVIDTIEREDYPHLANELGDLLFQIVFYAQLGKEAGYFDFDDIVREIGTKLLNRHPHVFPEATLESFGNAGKLTSPEIESNWEKLKQAERRAKQGEGASVLDDIPRSFPALTRAGKIQKRAATVGFDWPDHGGVLEKMTEELQELQEAIDENSRDRIEEELGDMFFTLVNLSRHFKIDPEACLRKAGDKFEKRFRQVEESAAREGKRLDDMTLDELERLWQQSKRQA